VGIKRNNYFKHTPFLNGSMEKLTLFSMKNYFRMIHKELENADDIHGQLMMMREL
jgi:hypothetical protein